MTDAVPAVEVSLPGAQLTDQDRRRSRVRRAAWSSIAAVGARLAAAVTAMATVPVLLGYLGLERYGLWVTAGAAVGWLGVGSLGLGPSLLNRLAGTSPGDQTARAITVASAWWLSLALAVLLAGLAVLLGVAGAWGSITNAPSGSLADDATGVAVVMGIAVAASIPLGIPLTIWRADQAGYLASATEVASSLLRLAAIIVAVSLDTGVVGVAVAAAAAPALILAIATAAVFGRRVAWPRPRYATRTAVRRLLGTGFGFTGMALAGLVISSTDVIVVAQVLGPASVPTYSVAFALLLLFVGIEMAVLDAIWPAYAEAAARGDRPWIAGTNRALTAGLVAVAAVFGLGLIAAGAAFIEWWAGADAVPPPALLVVLASIALVQGILLPHGRALTALGHVRRNTMLSLVGAGINIPASIVLATQLGVVGVALGTLIAYLATGPFLVGSARAAIARVGTPGLVGQA